MRRALALQPTRVMLRRPCTDVVACTDLNHALGLGVKVSGDRSSISVDGNVQSLSVKTWPLVCQALLINSSINM